MPPQTSKRLMIDIQRAKDPLLESQGIYYCNNEADMTKGHALIQGPANTPYEGCLLLFSIQFPTDYPFSPPQVLFMTSDGVTRFHPNLYVQGKVCLSILGTYSGPGWSGTQSLTSVLLSILGLLDDNPLSHEPAFEKGTLLDPKHREYADAVEHNLVMLMVNDIKRYEKDSITHLWSPFQDELVTILPSIKETLQKKINERSKTPERAWTNLTYGMGFRSYWKKLKFD